MFFAPGNAIFIICSLACLSFKKRKMLIAVKIATKTQLSMIHIDMGATYPTSGYISTALLGKGKSLILKDKIKKNPSADSFLPSHPVSRTFLVSGNLTRCKRVLKQAQE